jgi:hypothetical protein
MTITLNAEQIKALADAKGDSVRVIDPANKQDYVLVKAEVYERLQSLLADDAVYTTAEMLDRIMAEDDALDPQLAELQKKYGRAK